MIGASPIDVPLPKFQHDVQRLWVKIAADKPKQVTRGSDEGCLNEHLRQPLRCIPQFTRKALAMRLNEDSLSMYEWGIENLLIRLERTHPRYAEALTLQARMAENVKASRLHGDTETRRSERSEITDSLNRLSVEKLGISFNELCQTRRLDHLHPSSQPDSGAVRELLITAFSDEDLTTLCYDHFRSVYEDFASGMGKTQKIQRLVEHCERRGQVDALLNLVQNLNPAQYVRYKQQLG